MSRRAIPGRYPAGYDRSMHFVRRILKLAAAAVAFVLYVWFAAVRVTPAVKRRKARRRASPNPVR